MPGLASGAPAFLRHSVRRPNGHILITDPDGGDSGGDTVMCVHCQMHWIIKPGSGRSRGFCFNCGGVTCGKQGCEEHCVPFEKAIEEMEARGRLREQVEANFRR